MYEDASDIARAKLETVYNPPADAIEEDADSADTHPLSQDADYIRLIKFFETDRRILKVQQVVCENAFEDMKMDCIRGNCTRCGFKKIWSQGLRRKLVDVMGNVGKLKPGVHPVWLKRLRWWRFKTAKASPSDAVCDASNTAGAPMLSILQPAGGQQADKQTHRQAREGSIIDFLDEFETLTMKKYPFHRFTLYKTRESALQLCRYAPPGSLLSDRDWAERYTIIDARQIQSEYWCQRSCGLFISISKLLLMSAWIQRSGTLVLLAPVVLRVVLLAPVVLRAVLRAPVVLHLLVRCVLHLRYMICAASACMTCAVSALHNLCCICLYDLCCICVI